MVWTIPKTMKKEATDNNTTLISNNNHLFSDVHQETNTAFSASNEHNKRLQTTVLFQKCIICNSST